MPRRPGPCRAEPSPMTLDIIKAVVLGIVEGLTEFIPVSSTGHLQLFSRFFDQFFITVAGRREFWATFNILIQFGAILALLSIYFVRLWRLSSGILTGPGARRFVLGVVIAFLPAAVVGALAHDIIMGTLLNEWVICFALIVGGAILL